MSLKKSFFLLTFSGLLLALLLCVLLWLACASIASRYPSGGIIINEYGAIPLPEPTPEQSRLLDLLSLLSLLGCIVLPILGLGAASALFFRWKLQPPINTLLEGTRRIQKQDLAFTIPEISRDELGQVCAAFETMRAELLANNQQLWRQAEERRRLNAAFAHDLRNPITVLKGTIKLMQRQAAPGQTADLQRMAAYTARIEQYIEAMSSIQRLEEWPLHPEPLDTNRLKQQLTETARLLAPDVDCALDFSELTAGAADKLDYALFMNAAENLLNNAARFAQNQIRLRLYRQNELLCLQISDDGPGYPAELPQRGPRPFSSQSANHSGMGLYSCQTLCKRHGGWLELKNLPSGAQANAFFKIMSNS